ncbi:hypothetical protein LLE87_39475, partial [Paenibacillus polymyxa]|nr:hypothetical protein [Paenibacillus polymyxa]
ELNGLRVLVLHPQDAESRLLMSHLKRIGCVPTQQWPLPDTRCTDADQRRAQRIQAIGQLLDGIAIVFFDGQNDHVGIG